LEDLKFGTVPVKLGGDGEECRLRRRCAFPSARLVQLRTSAIPSHNSELVRGRIRFWDWQWGDRWRWPLVSVLWGSLGWDICSLRQDRRRVFRFRPVP